MFDKKKYNYKRLNIIKSIGVWATILILVPILGMYMYDPAYSSISSKLYDNIQRNFDNLLPFKIPELDKEDRTGSRHNHETDSQSTQNKFDNLLPFKVSPNGEKIPLELPPLNKDFPFEFDPLGDEWKSRTQSDDKSDSHSALMAATTPTFCTGSVDDKFTYQYFLHEGHTSPNGEWKNVYSGYGSTGVKINYDGRTAFWLYPQASTSASETHAALVKSTDQFCNFSMNVDMNTVQQRRVNSPANTWEVGWLFFRYSDTFHYYWLLVKPNGIELGKKDCDTCTDPVDGQKFLVTKSTPALKMNTWNNVKIDMVGNNIKVYWNGNLVIDYTDTGMSSKLASGSVAMYSEDAYVLYDNMNISPK